MKQVANIARGWELKSVCLWNVLRTKGDSCCSRRKLDCYQKRKITFHMKMAFSHPNIINLKSFLFAPRMDFKLSRRIVKESV